MDKLYLRVVEARGLPRGDILSKSDPYCVIRIKGNRQSFKTQVIQNTDSPRWNEDFVLQVGNPNYDILHIQVWDKDFGSPDDFLGELEVPVALYVNRGPQDEWKPLIKKRALGLLGGKNRGQIHLVISHGQPINTYSQQPFQQQHAQYYPPQQNYPPQKYNQGYPQQSYPQQQQYGQQASQQFYPQQQQYGQQQPTNRPPYGGQAPYGQQQGYPPQQQYGQQSSQQYYPPQQQQSYPPQQQYGGQYPPRYY